MRANLILVPGTFLEKAMAYVTEYTKNYTGDIHHYSCRSCMLEELSKAWMGEESEIDLLLQPEWLQKPTITEVSVEGADINGQFYAIWDGKIVNASDIPGSIFVKDVELDAMELLKQAEDEQREHQAPHEHPFIAMLMAARRRRRPR